MTDDNLTATVERLRETFVSGRTRDVDWRRSQLKALSRMMSENESRIQDALAADLGRPRLEAWLADVQSVINEIEYLHKHLGKWAGGESVGVPLIFQPARASVQYQPRGVVLVIAPWNFPVYLLVTPLAAALAAGNVVVCKPSELAPAASALLAELIPEYLDQDAFAVVEGGVEETTALLDERFDYILYTGNGAVGRIVAAAAAKHLTPTTLELGGKTPVIIDKDANLKQAVSRVAFAKWINAGQTCVAADHAYVHNDVHDEFVRLLVEEVGKRYGADPRQSRDFGRIVNERHTRRIAGLLDDGGFDEIAVGGDVDVDAGYVAPTVVTGVKPDAAMMAEEIFGPVLPVIGFDDISEPISRINQGEHPLALYVFGRANADRVLAETTSGGACVNDAMSHVFPPGLPFGGVGGSGYGAYHGKWGFETFSHRRSVYRRPAFFVEPPLLKAPYTAIKEWIARLAF